MIHSLTPIIFFFNNIYFKAFFLLSIILLFTYEFGNRWGYEGDDIVQVDGIINDSMYGNSAYNYHLQPLTYLVLRPIYQITENPELLFILPQLFGSVAILILTATLLFASQKKLSFFFSFLIILLFPELIITSLYFNSTIFGFPFFISVIFIIYYQKNKSTQSPIPYLLMGLLFTVAFLFRVDYIITLPIVLYLIFQFEKKVKPLLFFILSMAVLLITAFIAGIFDPFKIFYMVSVATSEIIYNKTKIGFSDKLFITYLITSWPIWVILFSYSVYYLISNYFTKNYLNLLILLPALFLFYPIAKLVTPKYIVPTLIFFPIVIVHLLSYLQDITSKSQFLFIKATLIVYIFFIQFYTIQFDTNNTPFPYLSINNQSHFYPTHDGHRTTGSYFSNYLQIQATRHNPQPAPGHILHNLLNNTKYNYLIVIPKKENILTWPAHYIAAVLPLQLSGYQRINKKNGDLHLKSKQRTIIFKWQNHQIDPQPNFVTIQFPYVEVHEKDGWIKIITFFYQQIEQLKMNTSNPNEKKKLSELLQKIKNLEQIQRIGVH